MFDQSIEALQGRISKLEKELGLDILSQESTLPEIETASHSTVVTQLAELQLKVKKILNSNEELKKLPQILREYGSEISSNASGLVLPDLVGQAEKQERLSARMEAIALYLNGFSELQNLDVPPFPSSLINSLKISALEQNALQLQELTQLYEILVVKNLLILYRYRELERREAEFWSNVDSRLLRLGAEIAKMTTDLSPV